MLRGTTTRRSGEAGMSLVELLVSMIILSIITTGLIVAWVSLQRGASFAVASSNSRATARDAISRVTNELRAAQPTALPTPSPSATVVPAGQPPINLAGPWEVRFHSSYNVAGADLDGTGVIAPRLTWIYLDMSGTSDQKSLYLKRDMDGNGSFTDLGDRTIILGKSVVNQLIPDSTNDPPTGGTSYTPLFRYAFRANPTDAVTWTDNTDGSLDLSKVVAVRIRVISDANIARTPTYIDTTTTVRLRNASAD
jgi:prepilin-type N-terminal cleavage/methylation domain-containing protein